MQQITMRTMKLNCFYADGFSALSRFNEGFTNLYQALRINFFWWSFIG